MKEFVYYKSISNGWVGPCVIKTDYHLKNTIEIYTKERGWVVYTGGRHYPFRFPDTWKKITEEEAFMELL